MRTQARIDSAEVVVIGGGAIGASIAYHLTALGLSQVVLVERDTLAAGSTSKAAGGIRLQFADELNIRIMQRSLSAFERFDEQFDSHIGFRQTGYLFLLSDPQHVRLFRSALALQQQLGVPSRELSPVDAGQLVPGLIIDDLLAATYCPADGYASPEAVVHAYASAAAAAGAHVLQGCEVTGIDVQDNRIASVETTKGRIATECVVCAAGVWSKHIGAMVGISLPVEPERHWLHFSADRAGLPDDLPLTIDFATGFYLHNEGPGLLFGGSETSLDELAAVATKRLPTMADLPVQTSWWGDYEISPDHNALVGEHNGISRFLYATGFSGHGFQQCPAIGEHIAQLITSAPPTLDLSPLTLERLERNLPRHEPLTFSLHHQPAAN